MEIVFNKRYFNCWRKNGIIDKATSNTTSNILKILRGTNKEVSLIKKGLTRFFLPLDLAIYKLFKDYLRELYISYYIKNAEEK